MAELIISKDEVVGIKKEIEEGSLELIFNALQSDIYSFPIKSFIRETISNGLDSIIEKDVFKAIDAGDPVEKYFLQRQDGELLKDSEYDPEYYNKKYLSITDKVLVSYIEGSPRDKVIIQDFGVGLGGKRLKGYFKIGWSSKRNFLTARGLYGLGSKSALATGVDYYLMTTVYNGYKTSFMIYNRDYENITPDSPTGKTEVWSVTMANNQILDKNIYWEKTSEQNSVTVEVEVKKHNKHTYINAVKDQFQYFNGKVTLKIVEQDKEPIIDYLNETPEFESENILIPKYSTYSSPHILVDGISYGLVSWNELELENRIGKVALKVSANQVDITQSRESLKWTDKTKNTILHAISLAEDEASEFVRNSINIADNDDIFALNDAYRLYSSTSSSVMTTFARFLQLHTVKPKYTFTLPPVDSKVNRTITSILSDNFFTFLFYSYDFKKISTYTEENKLKIRSELVKTFDSISNTNLVYTDETSLGPKLANHLLDKFNTTSFIYVRPNTTRIKEYISINDFSQNFKTVEIQKHAHSLLKKYNTLYLDDYEVGYDESEDDLEKGIELENTTVNLAKIRKMNKEVMWYEYQFSQYTSYPDGVIFYRTKHEAKISNLKDNCYGFDVLVIPTEYQKLGKMILFLNTLKKDPALKLVFVSTETAEEFMKLGAEHITNYFRKLNPETGELMIGEKLVQLNTIVQMHALKKKYNSFSVNSEIISNLSSIEKIKYDSFNMYGSRTIEDVMTHCANNDKDIVKEILHYLDSLANFQNIVSTKDKQAIAAKAEELFGTDKIYNIYAYDKDYVDSVEEELLRLSPIGPLIDAIQYPNQECYDLLNLLLTTIHKESN